MPDIKGDIARYDLNDPEDLAVLIDRGLIWRGGPRTQQKAIEAILTGEVPRPTRNVPPEVDAYLDQRMGPAREPLPESAPLAEPADEDPE